MKMRFSKSAYATGIALALAGSGSFAAPDTMAQNVTEARQESQIWTTYALNPYLRASDLKVTVHGGKATLAGTVEEGVNKELAAEIALGVSGISSVDNQIEVKADYAPPARGADRAFGEVVDDATITAAVKSKLAWSRHADALSTEVDTERGKVTLTGSADSGAEKELAGRLASNTRGVHAVDNRINVRTGKDAKAPVAGAKESGKAASADVADGWITAKVKSTYMYSSNVDGSDISVSTDKGVVTLSGKVDSGAERALAIELAQNIRGVRNVSSNGLKVSNVVATR